MSTALHRKYVDARNHLLALRAITPNVLPADDDVASPFIEDWTRRFRQEGGVIAIPSSTEEVSALMRYCNEYRIAVTPQGGNTGLCGGSVGIPGSLILSLNRMNSIEHLDENAGILTCEAGCTLQALDDHLQRSLGGFAVPLDMGSKSKCQIGGNVATNAGGLNVIRYGGLSRYLLGLEVVLGNGKILNMMRGLPKDNMGLHLPRLFLGSEGVLGVITRVRLLLVPRPRYSSLALLRLRRFDCVQEVLSSARLTLGDNIGAFEFFDEASLSAVREAQPQLLRGFSESLPTTPDSELQQTNIAHVTHAGAGKIPSAGITGGIHVLVQATSSSVDLSGPLAEWTSGLVSAGLVEQDGTTVSQNAAQERQLWKIREGIPVCLAQLSRATPGMKKCAGRLYKYDISLPLKEMHVVTEAVRQCISHLGLNSDSNGININIACFGHCGDLNLHLNILARPCTEGSDVSQHLDQLQEALDGVVTRTVTDLKGSLSAEHGVGQLKRAYMSFVRSEAELDLMRSIKVAFDPELIMNPGKMI